ncbi:hypothetical protein V495_03078 [Pseudogymnoascus sp. VKM F-4514 (FW-929)]|nr:hypothetical protein V495_03078 [Pseudogymnoascus sp. VKM F-4514 (FW-929)]KFY64040.1 hypothetical protein V497_01852 [Pseudogymnoascus sp. VKM F-4516 (FW-969)]
MDPQPTGKAVKDGRPRHKWTTFEGTVLMSLIIRNIHKTGLEKDELSKLADSTAPHKKRRNTRRAKEVADPDRLKYVDVATALNRALHKSDYTNDIPVEEVEKLLHFFLRDRKGAIAVIDRQPTARLTRSTHRIWNRGLNFLGTITEWDNGRKAAEEVKRREDEERRLNVGNAGAITAGANTSGVAAGWGDDTAAAPSGDGWGTAANENNTDTPAAGNIGAWGDAMEVDPHATSTNDMKTNQDSSVGAWGSGAAGSSAAVSANDSDPWGAVIERTIESNSATGAWGEPEASKTFTSSGVAAADWSATEDPFATPLPPSVALSTNKTTTLVTSWGVSGASTTTSVPAAVNSDPCVETATQSTDPVLDTAASAWGAVPAISTTGLSSKTTNNFGKAADSTRDPWGSTTKSPIAPFHDTTDTAADPWGTYAESTANQPSVMDWSTEVLGVASANSINMKNAEQTASPGVQVDKSVHMSLYDSWGAPTTDMPHRSANTTDGGWGEPISDIPRQSANTTDNGWGEPISETSRQFIAISDSGWGDNVERSQGGNSQVNTTAELSYSGCAKINNGHDKTQWSTTAAPVPLGPGPSPTTLEDSAADSGNQPLWPPIADESSQSNGRESSAALKNQTRQENNPDKTSNNPVQVAQLAGSGINPARLAMLTAAETDYDDEGPSFETTADEGLDQGRKSFKPTGTFGSKDNAIPLKFNRLAGKQSGSGDSSTTRDDWA